MATAEHDGVATALEPDLAEPCILSVMDGPVRVRARVLRPLLRCSARAHRPGRAARIDAQCDRGCCCTVLFAACGWLAGKRTHVV